MRQRERGGESDSGIRSLEVKRHEHTRIQSQTVCLFHLHRAAVTLLSFLQEPVSTD